MPKNKGLAFVLRFLVVYLIIVFVSRNIRCLLATSVILSLQLVEV